MLHGLGQQLVSHLTAMPADGFRLEGRKDRRTLLTQKGTPPSSPLRRSGMYTVEFSLLSLEDSVEEIGRGTLYPRATGACCWLVSGPCALVSNLKLKALEPLCCCPQTEKVVEFTCRDPDTLWDWSKEGPA